MTNVQVIFAAASGSPITVGTALPQPSAVATGDFNQDGKLDLAIANSGSNTVSLLSGNGNGTFNTLSAIPVGNAPNSIAVGNFNSDSFADLVVTNQNGISVLLGNGNGSFSTVSGSPFAAGGSPQSIAIGRFNNDSFFDIAVANEGAATLSIVLGNGNGTFQAASSFAAGGNATSVASGDINGDGILDLATANRANSTTSVLLGNGDGTFQTAITRSIPSTSPTIPSTQPVSVTIADFNQDNFADVATANANDETLSVLLSNGNGTLQNPTNLPVGEPPNAVVTGDVDGDGIPDLIAATGTVGTISVLVNAGNGTFLTAQNFNTDGARPIAIATGNFNNDPQLDLAVVNFNTGDVSILLNTSEVNDPPVNTVPASTQPISVGSALFFGTGRLIRVSDPDAGTNPIQIRLSVTNGFLDLGSTGGLIVTGNGTATITARGTIANINAGLNGLRFTPTIAGNTTLQLETSDQGFTGTGGVKTAISTIPIRITAPTLTVDTLVDENDGDLSQGDVSLREAIAFIENEGTITFAPTLAGGTIALTSGSAALVIDKNLTIDASTVANLTLSGQTATQLLTINAGRTVSLTGLHLTAGRSTSQGGAILNNGTLSLTNSTISNSNAVTGGGIANSGTLSLTNVTLGSNTASNSGGAILNSGSLTLTHVTIANNQAATGGGIINVGNAIVRNSLIATNTATTHPDVSGSFTSEGNNLVGSETGSTGFNQPGDQAGTSATPINPLISALGHYGGATPTFALLPGSPAINAANSSTAPDTDQRGITRNSADMGAFESQGFTIAPASSTIQRTAIGTAFNPALAATITSINDEPVQGGIIRFTAPDTGASGSFSGGAITAVGVISATGTAIAPTFTANTTVGTYAVTASARGATLANLNLQNTVGTPANITFISPTATATVNTSYPSLLQVRVTDAFNNPLEGISIAFNTPPANAGASGNFNGSLTFNAITNANGIATTGTLTANTVSGAFGVTANIVGTGLFASLTLTNLSGAIASFNITESPFTAGTIASVTITARDAFGNFVSNYNGTVNLSSTDSQATLPNPVTLVNGTATFNPIFRTAGSQTLTATAASNSALTGSQSIAVTPGTPASLTILEGTAQRRTVTTAFDPLRVQVKDAFGNAIAGASVTFSTPTGGAGASFNGNAIALTNAQGIATAPLLTANTIAGQYAISAAIGNLSIPFTLFNTAGVATTVTPIGNPSQSTVVNTAFVTPLQVKVSDAFGNPIAGNTVTFVAPDGGASGTFNGNAIVVTDAQGIATAPSLVANAVAGKYIVRAIASGISTSAVFSLNNGAIVPVPTLTLAVLKSGRTALLGNFNATANSQFGISFFAGQTLLGTTTFTTDNTGRAQFAFDGQSVPRGTTITAQVTDLTTNLTSLPSIARSPINRSPRATLLGTPRADRLTAKPSERILFGMGGADRLTGRKGASVLFGGAGNDTLEGGRSSYISGGAGQDTITGGTGVNTLLGEEGNDRIQGGRGRDYIHGGSGNDRINPGQGTNLIFGGSGSNTIQLTGGQDTIALEQGGIATIQNFRAGRTILGIVGGLTFNDLSIVAIGNSTLIEIASTGVDLARLERVRSNGIGVGNFVAIES